MHSRKGLRRYKKNDIPNKDGEAKTAEIRLKTCSIMARDLSFHELHTPLKLLSIELFLDKDDSKLVLIETDEEWAWLITIERLKLTTKTRAYLKDAESYPNVHLKGCNIEINHAG